MVAHVAREVEGVTVIDVDSSFSREAFTQLLAMIQQRIEKSSISVLLNLAKLPQINSEGIGFLVLIHDRCQTAGGHMALCNVQGMVEHVLKLAGVLTFFKIHPDEQTGIADITGETKLATAAAEVKPAKPNAPAEPEDLASAAREIVKTVIRSRLHQRAVEFFTRRSIKAASLDQIAASLNIPTLAAEHVMRDLAQNGIVIDEGQVFVWKPSPQAERKLSIFRRALADPKLHTRLLAWVYAQEKQ